MCTEEDILVLDLIWCWHMYPTQGPSIFQGPLVSISSLEQRQAFHLDVALRPSQNPKLHAGSKAATAATFVVVSLLSSEAKGDKV